VAVDSKVHRRAGMPPVEALRGFRLSLPAGHVGALVGPSGCGKTTALRIAAGLDADYEGSVTGAGGRLGFVFQEPLLLPWRSVEQNVRLAAEAAGTTPDFDALFAALGLSGHRDRFPGELSLGLARRAAIARAFAVDPELLLLDEPFVSLDEETARAMRREFLALQARTRPTTLVVTHDIEEAAALADIVFVLSPRPGRVVERIDAGRAGDAGSIARIRAAARPGG
jgi:ABC-type nitrate/sulfonate/bicarbonate transport system ATPase subunit